MNDTSQPIEGLLLASRSDRRPASRPVVSVVMIAYNVERFIAKAVESVLAQEVDFPYELVIGEDCSTDRTRDILRQYQERHPDRIRLISREANIGMNPNFVATLDACRGDYIALLDGDDYWTFPQKLQRQLMLLESNAGLTAVFHNALVAYEDEDIEPHPFHARKPVRLHERTIPKPISSLKDLIPGNFVQTGSVMFRAGPCSRLRDWSPHFPTFDWPLHLLNADAGGLCYVDEIWSVYRVRHDGVWSGNMAHYNKLEHLAGFLGAYHFLEQALGGRFRTEISERLASFHYRIALSRARAGEWEGAVVQAKHSLVRLPVRYRFTGKYFRRQWHLVRLLAKAGWRRLKMRRQNDDIDSASTSSGK